MKNKRSPTPGDQPLRLWRCVSILLVFVLMAVFLSQQLFTLQILEGAEWAARATNQQLSNVTLPASRGNIYDSNMTLLAQDIAAFNVEAAPNVLPRSGLSGAVGEEAARVASRELAAILNLDEGVLYDELSDEDSMYYRVATKIDKPTSDAIEEMVSRVGLSGIYIRADVKRLYPNDELAATVLGFTNMDGDGIEGLEFQYNDVLAGVPGRSMMLRDARGGEIDLTDSANYPPQNGHSLVLTLNAEIQNSAEKYLAEAIAYHDVSQRGMCIVMDVNTGAILAMVTSSAYNPNQPYAIFDEDTRLAIEAMPAGEEANQATADARILQWRNKALADTYEPGSVFKVITAAAALDSGQYSANSSFNCSSQITIADRDFRCALQTAHGQITLQEALIHSCNTSFITMAQHMGAETFHDYLCAFGLNEPTGVDLPGEPGSRAIANLVYPLERLGPVELSSCSFGQSNKFTALQMITAFSAAVNGGFLVQPHIVGSIIDTEGNVIEIVDPLPKRQVVSEETCAVLNEAMEHMVSNTPLGRNSYVAGFHVGGKSGTSEKLEIMVQENREAYISSFCGMAPANDPQIAVLVVLDESSDPHAPGKPTWFGGRIAGPTAGNIISDCMDILGIEPNYDGDEAVARQMIGTPGVQGLSINDATTRLREVGLNSYIVGEGTTVVDQSPRAGMEVPYGGQIVLYTEEGATEQMAQVPDLLGLSAQEAIVKLQSLGLNALTTGAPNDSSSVKVIEQEYPPGTEIPLGTHVSLNMHDVSNVAD